MPLADMPLSNKQHAVPQNIMDVEFKLVGDLTMRQFAYLLIFGIMAYLSTVTIVGLFKWPAAISFGLLALGLAFIPVQERGLDEWIVNFIRSVYTPTQRAWHKEPTIPTAFMQDSLDVVKQELITLAPTSSRRRLEEYLKYQDDSSNIDPLDIPERKYAMKVHDAFAEMVPTAEADSGVAVVVYDLPEVLSMPPLMPQNQGQDQSQTDTPQQSDLAQMPEKPLEKPVESVGTPQESKQEPRQEESRSTSQAFSEKSSPRLAQPEQVQVSGDVSVPLQTKQPQQSQSRPQIQMQQQRGQATNVSSSQAPQRREQPKKKHILSETRIASESSHLPMDTFAPITPDMHSGRRFTNLLPESGELVLPIRGERVIKTVAEVDVENEIKEKAAKLEELLKNLKEREGVKVETSSQQATIQKPSMSPGAGSAQIQATPIPMSEVAAPQQQKQAQEQPVLTQPIKQVSSEATDIIEKLRQQNEELTKEIQSLKDEINAAKSASKETSGKEDLLKKLEVQREKITTSYSQLNKQVEDLQSKIKEKGYTEPDTQQGVPARQPSFANIPSLTTKPNILSGVVKGPDGKGLENTLLIVKNERQEPIRAFKTNSLGQFMLTSPLLNGNYTVEVNPAEGTNLTFDIISVQLKGDFVSPLEIVSKS